MGKRRVYNVENGSPEVRTRIAQARAEISTIVNRLNSYLSDKALSMTFSTSVIEEDDRRPAAATLKAWLNFGLVKPEEEDQHLSEIAEAEAREAAYKRARERR